MEVLVRYSFPRSHIIRQEKAICGSPVDNPWGIHLTKMDHTQVNCKRCVKKIEKEIQINR